MRGKDEYVYSVVAGRDLNFFMVVEDPLDMV